MEKQIIKAGYLINALTDGSKIFGIVKDSYPIFVAKEFINKQYYWSDIFVYSGFTIVAKGVCLINPTTEELTELHEQSKVNLR